LPGNEKKVVDSVGSCLHTNIIKESEILNMLEEELGHKSDSPGISQADGHREKVSLDCIGREYFSDAKWSLTLKHFSTT
jgi:hypothetical protein